MKYLSQSLESVASQTLIPKQVIVIDDGSSQQEAKSLFSITNQFPSLNIQVVRDGVNLGHTARMNQALELSTEDFFMLLSADDWLEPTALEVLSTGITITDDVIWGNLKVVNEDGSARGYVRPRENWQGPTARRYQIGGHVFQDLLKVNSFVTGGMSLLRVKMLKQVGGWDESVTTEDFDLWLRIGKTATFRYVDQVVGNYRQVPGSKSRNDNKKLIDQAKIFSKYSGQSKQLDWKLSYLAAMRWSLALARMRRLPEVTISQMAEIMKVRKYQIWLTLPKSIVMPLFGSAKAYLRRKT